MRNKQIALSILIVIASLSGTESCIATELPKTMSKISVRVIEPKPKEGSFQAQPKTYYRATKQYMRAEEELDKEMNIKALTVANEPDIWMMELVSKTGKKLKDPGPTYNVILPIYGSPVREKELAKLEYGMELDYFTKRKIKASSDKIDGKQVDKFETTADGCLVKLWVDPKSKKPLIISASKDGRTTVFEYVVYEPALKFDAAKFAPPKDVKFAENPPWLVRDRKTAGGGRK